MEQLRASHAAFAAPKAPEESTEVNGNASSVADEGKGLERSENSA